MVAYEEYTQTALSEISESEFNKIEPVAVAILAAMCGSSWDEGNATCVKAVIFQIDYIQSTQGAASWLSGGSSTVASRSYSVGGESESVSYGQSKGTTQRFTYNGLEISPYAISLLRAAGLYSPVKGVRVC